MLPAGDPRMEWTLRLIGMGIDGQSRNWLRVFEGRRIWLEAASVPGFRRSAERCAQKNCPIRANPNYDEIALPVPTFGHSGLPAIGLTPNSARQQKSEDWGGLQLK